MVFCIVLADNNHLLESMETRSKEEIVIRVTEDAKEVTIDPASKSAPSENVKEVIHVDTVEDCTKDCSLAETISETEDGGETSIPIDIGELVHIDEDEESDKDHR